MLGTGIPELRDPDDVVFLKAKLYPELGDADAVSAFGQLIKLSMASSRTKLNNLAHNLHTD
jgi:hypothetical protein